MQAYEICFIARQELSESQVEEIGKDVEKIITDAGGKIHKTEYWGLRNLAYRIRKNRKGHYMLIEFEAPGEASIEIERVMRIKEDVLRFMTVKIDKLSDGPSPIMERQQQKEAA